MKNTLRELELLLFISREPLKRKSIQKLLEINSLELKDLIEELRREYDDQKKGFTIKTFSDEVQLGTNQRYEELIKRSQKESDDKGLGHATMEVLSIIAYKQPVTKVQIDYLRGVNSDYSLRQLLSRELIEVCGQLDTIGNPKLYATTSTFLKVFNLEELEDLPLVEEMS